MPLPELQCVSDVFVESALSREVIALEATFPKHTFIYAGSPLSLHDKRQSLVPPFDEFQPLSFAPNGTNSTLAAGGILKRYQLLTPALITSLLIVFFLLVPMIMMAVNALASIQSPLRLDAPKGPNQEKKNQ